MSQELIAGGYELNTPVAIVYKATWPDEEVLFGTLGDISQKVKEANITKMSQILVGNFIEGEYELSKLYDKTFTHKFRKGIDESSN